MPLDDFGLVRSVCVLVVLLPVGAPAQPAGTASLAQPDGDAQFHPAALDTTTPFFTQGTNELRLTGGFSGTDGSFVAVTDSAKNLLHLGETLHLSAEVAVRKRSIEFGLTRASPHNAGTQYGFDIYAQRFHYNQEQRSKRRPSRPLSAPALCTNRSIPRI